MSHRSFSSRVRLARSRAKFYFRVQEPRQLRLVSRRLSVRFPRRCLRSRDSFPTLSPLLRASDDPLAARSRTEYHSSKSAAMSSHFALATPAHRVSASIVVLASPSAHRLARQRTDERGRTRENSGNATTSSTDVSKRHVAREATRAMMHIEARQRERLFQLFDHFDEVQRPGRGCTRTKRHSAPPRETTI